MAGPEEPVRTTVTEARAGVKVGTMRYVLGISMVLVIVIFTIIVLRPFG